MTREPGAEAESAVDDLLIVADWTPRARARAAASVQLGLGVPAPDDYGTEAMDA
jgi:hypothetical protein